MKLRRDLEHLVRGIVNRSDIEDIVQETFVRSYEAERDRPIRHPRAFMFRTAKHIALNHIQRSDQRLVDSFEDFIEPDALMQSESVEAQFESKERFVMFCRAVRTLPAQCRRAFILKKVYGLSQKEVAEYLGIAESTVEKHVAKGLLDCWTYLQSQDALDSERASSEGNQRKSGHG